MHLHFVCTIYDTINLYPHIASDWCKYTTYLTLQIIHFIYTLTFAAFNNAHGVPEPDKLVNTVIGDEKTVPNPFVDFAALMTWDLVSCVLKLVFGIVKAEIMLLNYLVDAVLSTIGVELPFLQSSEQVIRIKLNFRFQLIKENQKQ